MVHSMLQRKHGDNIHPSKSNLEGPHCQVWLGLVEHKREPSILHFVFHVSVPALAVSVLALALSLYQLLWMLVLK